MKTAFSGLFQLGYVTRDVRAAEAMLRDGYGIDRLDISEARFDVTTPRGAGEVSLLLGFAYVDDLMIEVIQPVAGEIGIYTEALERSGGVLASHHTASLITGAVENWDAFRASIAASGREVALEGVVGDGLRFIYVDDRERVGHYLEYMWFSEPFFKWFTKNMPRF